MTKDRVLHLLGSLLVLAVFAGAAWLLHGQWVDNKLTFEKVRDDLLAIKPFWIAAAIGLTAFNYVVLTFYDYLAFRYAKVPISLGRVAFAAIIGYAFSYNFGATLTGIPLRYRLYSSWNIALTKIVQLLVILAFTFWFGVFALSGVLFVAKPLRIPHKAMQDICSKLPDKAVGAFRFLFADSTKFGVFLLVLAAAYVAASIVHRGSLKVFRWTIPVPPPGLTLSQIGIASADMFVAASVLWALCPHVHGGYLHILEVYLVAFVLNVLSHVPGGWGVIEAVILGFLGTLGFVAEPDVPKVVAAIIVFRVVYFFLPLLVATLMLGWHEFAVRNNWVAPVAPQGASGERSEK